MCSDGMCWRGWVKKTLKNIRSDVEATQSSGGMVHAKLDKILERLRIMGEREDAAWAKNSEDLAAVKSGWDALVTSNTAKDAQIVALQAALDAANAGTSEAVQAALAVDSDADAVTVEAANTALESLLTPPAPEPPAEG